MSLTSLAVALAAPLPDIEKFDSFLFIGPHPDDIEIGAGATAAKLAAIGKRVGFLICIDGSFGDGAAPAGISGPQLIALRQQESLASAKFLGIDSVHFLGFCDGGFYDKEALVREMAKYIGQFKPDVIFAPDPCVTSECHIDHLNVGSAASRLACFAPYKSLMAQYGAEGCDVQALAYYMTAKPTRYVKTKGFLQKQLDSVFLFHRSQYPEGSEEGKAIALYLKIRSADMGLRCLCTSAEGFRVLGQTQMHCLPEAGR